MGSEVLLSGMEKKMNWGFYLRDWNVEKKMNWSSEENKIFEKALAFYDTETPDKWHNIAKIIPGKSVEELKSHYKHLEEDVNRIEAGIGIGIGPIPFTLDDLERRQTFASNGNGNGNGKRPRNYDHDRKKGIPWTEEEHRLFLMGLKKYGKGDWRNISRNFVTSRTPTQVASHAQKYFLRLTSGSGSSGKDKRRSSIHDITTANLSDTTTTQSKQHPSSHSTLTDQFSVITHSTQSKEPPGMLFNPWSSGNFFAHGTTAPLKVKLEYQNLQTSHPHERVLGDQNMFRCDIPS